MSQDLLDLPPEILQRVVHELVSDVGVVGAWKLRGVCRTFAAEIHDDIFARQSKEVLMASMDTAHHLQIFENNVIVYMRNRLNKRLDANGILVSKLEELWAYLMEKLHIREFEKRQEYATRLIEGLLHVNRFADYWKVFIWDEQLRSPWNGYADQQKIPATAAEKLMAAVAGEAYDLVPSLFGLFEVPRTGAHMMFNDPLTIATSRMDTKMVRTLIGCYKKNHPQNNAHCDKVDAISWAIKVGNIDALELLIAACRPWDNRYSSEKVLHRSWIEDAVRFDSIPALDIILEKRGGRKGMLTQDVIKTICKYGNDHVVNHYIQKGLLDVNKAYSLTSPLVTATRAANIGAMTTLISAGADVNKATTDGTTPLFIASRFYSKDTMTCLLDNGANTDTENWPECRYDTARLYLREELASRAAAQAEASKSSKSGSRKSKR
ncbi:hypothetical protein SLS60_006957 [Paraconiothyrium brasiliense]|uniref:Ankyrin repeat protein n=1 Tax=Paraconiothyrium brasiliense TaxID=300254 RepID=A0ABR3R819_9PLEO